MGVAGSGKTTVGKMLAKKLGFEFADADDFHPPANIQKMSEGQPLDDRDRAEWLEKINEFARKKIESGSFNCLVACSALKEKYRKTLSEGIENQVVLVFLQGDFETVRQRLEQRQGHFLPPSLLQSQFQILESPANAFVVDIRQSPDEIVEAISNFLETVSLEGSLNFTSQKNAEPNHVCLPTETLESQHLVANFQQSKNPKRRQ